MFLTIGEIEQLTEEEHIDVAIEEFIKEHYNCTSECPDHYETSEEDSNICYRELPCAHYFNLWLISPHIVVYNFQVD